jgi:hypothetical protein
MRENYGGVNLQRCQRVRAQAKESSRLGGASSPGRLFGFLSKRLFGGLLFTFFLWPVSLEGISVNYSFAVWCLWRILTRGRVQRVGDHTAVAIAHYLLVFVVASALQWNLVELWGRRLVSFLVFMTVFAFSLTGVRSENEVESFKTGLVLISVVLSLQTIGSWFSLSRATPLHFEAKDLIGSQRVGFVYIMGIWVCLMSAVKRWRMRILQYSCLAIIGLGALLTFSRATVMAFVGTVFLFLLHGLLQGVKRKERSQLLKRAGVLVAVMALVGLAAKVMPLTFEFYKVRLIEALAEGKFVENLGALETSEGTRVAIGETILATVIERPLTGSGYLGIWSILGEDVAGSAHNQYTDVLLRTGPIGLLIYCGLLWKVARWLYRNKPELFWGFCGFLLYGLFHETAKESQGAVILSFLLGMAESRRALGGERAR